MENGFSAFARETEIQSKESGKVLCSDVEAAEIDHNCNAAEIDHNCNAASSLSPLDTKDRADKCLSNSAVWTVWAVLLEVLMHYSLVIPILINCQPFYTANDLALRIGRETTVKVKIVLQKFELDNKFS
ncbi:Uncharacterized protein Fot_24636 [Forsythia ovata]|uniref:Uncharacterized protein n=1 Tax=Forsythia ovata TaxID=205694 RepID=A0ABD1U7U6_9LAMI